MGIQIDINSDVGEGINNESEIFKYISSCNVACGGHYGDVDSMRLISILAKKNNVKVGAHPSYPDKENFGRLTIKMSPNDFITEIEAQVDTFYKILCESEIVIHHIKPHGALYNDLVKDEGLANSFLEAIKQYKNDVFLYVPPNSIIKTLALQKGFKIKVEAFADRNYNNDLSLVSRKLDEALIEESQQVLQHLLLLVNNQVKTVTKKLIPIKAETFCIHGDTPSALKILQYLSVKLPEHNIVVRK